MKHISQFIRWFFERGEFAKQKPACDNCYFYKDDTTGNHIYTCQRFPQWVKRSPWEWCGEWKQK